jgi:cell wall-associated NlpC family hydrolase
MAMGRKKEEKIYSFGGGGGGVDVNGNTSAIYANVIAKLKETERARESVEMKISDLGIYCVMWSLQQIPTLQHADPSDFVVYRTGIYR